MNCSDISISIRKRKLFLFLKLMLMLHYRKCEPDNISITKQQYLMSAEIQVKIVPNPALISSFKMASSSSTCCIIMRTGFVHFFRPKIQGLFKDFPGPYFEISRTLSSKNLPQTKQTRHALCTCGSTYMRESNERALGTKQAFLRIL